MQKATTTSLTLFLRHTSETKSAHPGVGIQFTRAQTGSKIKFKTLNRAYELTGMSVKCYPCL